MFKLSSRLTSIASFISDNSSIIDVGCDHGLLDCFLAKEKINIKIIASDINENALNNAKKNIKKYHLEDKIQTVLSKGLDNIDTKGVDTIVIAGMGAHTMVGILYNNIKKLKKVNRLILQSNNDLDFIRHKITKMGYYIKEEKLVKDAGIIYTIIEFEKGYRFYSKKSIYLGPCLIKENSKLFREKLKLELQKMEKFYPVIPKQNYHYRRKIAWRIKILKRQLGIKK